MSYEDARKAADKNLTVGDCVSAAIAQSEDLGSLVESLEIAADTWDPATYVHYCMSAGDELVKILKAHLDDYHAGEVAK